jgi:hypothetical protein
VPGTLDACQMRIKFQTSMKLTEPGVRHGMPHAKIRSIFVLRSLPLVYIKDHIAVLWLFSNGAGLKGEPPTV